VLFHLKGFECIRGENLESLSFVGGLSPIRVTSIGWSFILRLRLLSVIVVFERLLGGALHHFL